MSAMIAVNQTIGRVIRNQKDYGCIYLFDFMYAEPGRKYKEQLPGWVRETISKTNNFK